MVLFVCIIFFVFLVYSSFAIRVILLPIDTNKTQNRSVAGGTEIALKEPKTQIAQAQRGEFREFGTVLVERRRAWITAITHPKTTILTIMPPHTAGG